jgi:hypothetical protein
MARTSPGHCTFSGHLLLCGSRELRTSIEEGQPILSGAPRLSYFVTGLITLGAARNECGTLRLRDIDAGARTSHTGFELPFGGYSYEVTGMSTSPPPPPPGTAASVGQRIDEAIELIQMELRHAVAYVNDAVVPQVRRESISAMRTVADTLRSLADRMDRNPQSSSQTGSQTTSQASSKGPQS